MRWHLASVKSLCPFGQPEKALGHEPQIDPWLPHRTTTRLASFRTRSASSLLMKMHLPRWNNPRHNTPRASSIANGLDVANQTRASGAGRKMFLTCPLIDQAISLKIPVDPERVVKIATLRGRSTYGFKKCFLKSCFDRSAPSSVSITDFALLTGSSM